MQLPHRARIGATLVALALLAAFLLTLDGAIFPQPLATRAGGSRPDETIDSMRRLAFRRHSTRMSDYYRFRFHWPKAALILILTSLLATRLPKSRGPLAAISIAVLTLGLVDAFALELIPRGPYVPDPTCVWALQGNLAGQGTVAWLRTNNEGYRPTAPVPSPAGTVLLLGDSTTFGCRIARDEQTYAWLLTDKLGGGVRVVNRAIPGYSSWQGVQMLRRTVEVVKPDVVVAAFMANDWAHAETADRELDVSSPSRWLRQAMSQSRLYLYLSRLVGGRPGEDKVEAAGREAVSASTRVSPEEYRANLENLRALCVQHEAWLVVVALPMHASMKEKSAPYRAVLETLRGDDQVTVVDLFTLTQDPSSQAWFVPTDPIHPDATGHEFIARMLARAIAPHIKH